MVLTLRGDRVCAITGLVDSSVFASFGLPRTLRRSARVTSTRPTAPASRSATLTLSRTEPDVSLRALAKIDRANGS
jgi:hypothetical protein